MSAAESEIARLVVRAKADLIPAVVGFVRETVLKLAMPVNDAEKLAVLVEEVCDCIAGGPGDTVFHTVILHRPRQVAVIVSGGGSAAGTAGSAARATSLIKSLLDKRCAERLGFSIEGQRITGIEIVKDLPLWDVVPEASIPALTAAVPAGAPLELRLMRPDEGASLAHLMYRCYSYGYARGAVYSPETVRHYLSSGLIVSYVAVGAAGEIVGHVALEREKTDSPVAEMGMAVVDPRYRGRKVLERLSELVVGHARQLGLAGLFAEAVTSHTYSQRSALSLGFRETGVMLGLIPVAGRHGAGQMAARRSALYMYRTFGRRHGAVVFPPAGHDRIVRRIYENAGIERRFDGTLDISPSVLSAPVQLEVDVRTDAGRACITIADYGADLRQALSLCLEGLCGGHIECVYLDIPLEKPAAAPACDEIEALGFSFCGVIPETAYGDMLRFQYLNKVELSPDDRQTASEFGRELMDYVMDGIARVNTGCVRPGQ